MSQGYSYAPPTLDEAIKAYQRAKKKEKDIDSYSQRKKINGLTNNLTPTQPSFRTRQKGNSQGSISEIHYSDEVNDYDDEDKRRKIIRSRKFSNRRRKEEPTYSPVPSNNIVPAWSQGVPGGSIYPPVPQYSNMVHYSNLHYPPPLPNLQQYRNPYVSNLYPSPFCYPYAQPAPSYVHPPIGTQYNIKPAEPMNQKDFQRDCKCSPTPSRPYSDSDLLESVSNRAVRDSERFNVIPPIKKMDRSDAAKVIQRNYRGYKDKKNSDNTIKETFYSDFIDKLIDELLTDELLPDLLVEVLLYGVRDVKLPSITERVVREHGDQIMDECVHEMLSESINSVMAEMLSVYSGKKSDLNKHDRMNYVIDELISLQIREVVNEFMQEYIIDYQCERIYNQLVFESLSILANEVSKEGETNEPVLAQNLSKAPFDLDSVILASVLCKSLVPNEDHILDSVIAQGLVNQLRNEGEIS